MVRIIFALAFLACNLNAAATITYVKWNAFGLNNGTSWANAYTDLYSILYFDHPRLDTIWVANGTYRPYSYTSFHLQAQEKMFGGFEGTETQLSQRNWTTFLTILDGDIGVPGVKTDNAQHVIILGDGNVSDQPVVDMRIDGFKIQNGYGIYGAGLFSAPGTQNATCSSAVANCYFYSNESSAGGGGAQFAHSGNHTISNCIFEKNKGKAGGGICFGRYVQSGGIGNSVAINGLHTITDCVFKNDSAVNGGAFYTIDTEHVQINRCLFIGNVASVAGGALFDTSVSNTEIYNSLIVGNLAAKGCVYYTPPIPAGNPSRPHIIVHTTIAHNRSASTAGTDYAVSLNGGEKIKNCILWNNTTGSGKQIPIPATGSFISDNIIEGSAGMVNTTNSYSFDPQFVAPGTALAAPFPSTGTYDYHLKLISAAIDTGGAAGLTGSLNFDKDVQPRSFGLHPDLGAYEKSFCSKSISISASGPTSFCLPDSVVLTASGGISGSLYEWNAGAVTGSVITARATGTYKVINADTNNCRGSASIFVNANALIAPVITQRLNVLSVSTGYVYYQWYRNDTVIAGANAASYIPLTNGIYTVVVKNAAGCTGTSTIYKITGLAVTSWEKQPVLSIYPNPGDGHYHIAIEAAKASTYICMAVSDITGRQVIQKTYSNAGLRLNDELDISALAKGVYFISLNADGARVTARIILE